MLVQMSGICFELADRQQNSSIAVPPAAGTEVICSCWLHQSLWMKAEQARGHPPWHM